MAIAGDPPRERKPEKGEKPADKERWLDKQFAESAKETRRAIQAPRRASPRGPMSLQARRLSRAQKTVPSLSQRRAKPTRSSGARYVYNVNVARMLGDSGTPHADGYAERLNRSR